MCTKGKQTPPEEWLNGDYINATATFCIAIWRFPWLVIESKLRIWKQG